MPTHEVEVISQEVTVGGEPADIYGFYMVPPDPDALAELLRRKAGGEVPQIVRVRLECEVTRPHPPGCVTTGDVSIIDCGGGEVSVAKIDIPPESNAFVKDVDVTEHFTKCGAGAPLGINAVRVRIYPAHVVGPYGVIYVTAKYYVRVKVWFSWGW